VTVTLKLIQPQVSIVFANSPASVVPGVDADTVLGVVPGATGLDILDSTNQAQAQAALGLTGSSMVPAVQQRIGAHETARNPHRQYALDGQAQQSSEAFAHRIGAHETSPNPHRQYIAQDQAVLSAILFGA